MKPLQIGLLVVAGAITGALVMKVGQRPGREEIQAAVAAPEPGPAPAVTQAVPAAPAATVHMEQPPPQMVAEPVMHRPRMSSPAAKPRPARRIAAYNPPIVYHVPTTKVREEAVVTAPGPPAPPVTAPPRESAEHPSRPPASTPPASNPPASNPPASNPPASNPPARAEPEQATPVPPPPPEAHKVTLNAGFLIPVRLVDGLSAERNRPGDLFSATLDKELVVDEFVIAERGARVEGRVVASDPGGKTKGVSTLAVELTKVHTSDGQRVAIRTESFERRAEPSHREDAQKVAAGAVAGAIVGAIAAGGKGAAAGAGIGGAAGTADVLLTRGKPATLPSETRITFRLEAPVTLTERTQ